LFDAFRLGDALFGDMSATGLSGSDGSSTYARERAAERDTIAPLLLTIPEAARILAIGRTTLYELISTGAIEAVHIGRAIRIPVESARAFVESRRPAR
jgi:excisionase family DNA binding protein